MNIAFIGLGGVGGYFAGLLAREGSVVHVVARGRHLDAVRSEGLRVEAADGAFTVRPATAEADARAVPECDAVFVCVKNYDLDGALDALRPFAGERACFVSLLNGMDAVSKLSATFPGRTLAGQCSVLAEILRPGVVRQAPGPRQIVIGELDHRRTGRLTALEGAFDGTGVDLVVSDEIEVELWTKMIFISCLAAVVAATRSSVGEVLECAEARGLYVSAIHEAAAVARAEGAAIGSSIVQAMLSRAEALDPRTKFSLLRDLESRRRTEIDVLNGAVVRMGRDRGVPTPTHAFLYAALRPAHLRGCFGDGSIRR